MKLSLKMFYLKHSEQVLLFPLKQFYVEAALFTDIAKHFFLNNFILKERYSGMDGL